MKVSSISIAAAILPHVAWAQLETTARLRTSRSLADDLLAFEDEMSLAPTSLSMQYIGHGEHGSKSGKGPEHGSKSGKGDKGAKSGKAGSALYVFCDIADDELGLINTDTEALIQVPYCDIAGWPFCSASAITQHTAIDKSGKNIYISTVSNGDQVPASMVIVTYDEIDWDEGKVSNLRVLNTIEFAGPTALSEFDYSISQTDPSQPQPIPWASPTYSQLHGPSFRPSPKQSKSEYIYWGTWTNKDLIAMNLKNGNIDTQSYGDISAYSHGYFFNPSGDKAIGATYWFDSPAVGLYEFGPGHMPTRATKIYLDNGDNTFGSFTHYASWWDDRYAYLATMQLGSTSLSGNYPVSGPGVYLIDAVSETATRVAGTSENADDAGVWNSGSDTIIANNKLYISEEKTLDGNFPEDGGVGSVGVFAINQDMSLSWIKRLSFGSGDGIPEGFGAAHGSAVVKSGGREFVYVPSYISNHIIKIDTETDTVVKVWDETDGLAAPHGGFSAGSIR